MENTRNQPDSERRKQRMQTERGVESDSEDERNRRKSKALGKSRAPERGPSGGTSFSKKARFRLIDGTKHHILKAAHPSGLSANRGFFGCRHFSGTNQLLEEMGMAPIDWQL